MTIFAIEMNGKNRPFPLERLELKRYSYVYKFLRLGLAQVPQFRCFPLVGYRHF